VLRLVADGLLYKQVAARIGVSERAVKYHMGEILARLHVHNRAEAVATPAASA
jgi:DNA-binding NarL/FixJ family response regulator